ncbi:tigr02452 family protein [Diplodia corticola]|uniref:Tigr02452 family protein n=1 Tax=Diplodia corticola TaxID=236234 RepID=A0A1J9RQH9_9PEZI|nr:tigr02452 family protein [Diplodia corticola]OJD30703.1 tigr02452 family protein [Diplodia corticola]
MGRTEPTVVVPPQSFRRDVRAKKAKATINQTIPALLNTYPRARRGVDAAELIVDPPPLTGPSHLDAPKPDAKSKSKSKPKGKGKARGRDEDNDDTAEARGGTDKVTATQPPERPPMQLKLQVTDTLEAAVRLGSTETSKRPRVAVLNMASPLRPGGGLLNGATSQEEWLCLRTTLYPSLRDEFYRLPEVGAIYTPDVLVFRRSDDEAAELDKKERFFVDVVSAGMLRFPDVEGEEGEEKKYANCKERDLVVQKMKAVMRILRMKGADKVVLGAWGCGAYGNPVGEVAQAWKKVLFGTENKKKARTGSINWNRGEGWDGLEVVFAIKDERMARQFASFFGSGLIYEEPLEGARQDSVVEDDGTQAAIQEMTAKIAELETQMAQARMPDLKARLGTVLEGLKRELATLARPPSPIDDASQATSDQETDEDHGLEQAHHEQYHHSDDEQGRREDIGSDED